MEIGGYELAQQLPGGRFGARSRATGPRGENVLLKEFARLEPATTPVLLEELARLRGVSNPHLARNDEPVRDATGDLWLVEEWVEGVSLGALTEEHLLSRGQALGVARGMLSGLAALHQAGLAHGLVSPATVMLDLAGQPRLVDSGTWVADSEVAATDEYAAPEVVAGAAPGTTADVFSVGKVIGEVLPDPLDSALAAILATATSPEPAARQHDAATLLAQLSQAAERAYGPLWWTLEGVGGVVATAVGAGAAGAATTGVAAVAGPGSAGVVSGSLGMGNAAIVAGTDVAAGGAGLVQGVAKAGNRLRTLIPVLVGVVVIVAAGLAVANTTKPQPATLNAPSSAVTPTPLVSTSPTPTASPTPPAALGFNGTYTYVSIRTKSNDPRFPVGQKQTTKWVVTTTCLGQDCTSTADVDGSPVPIAPTTTGWVSDLTFPSDCIRFDTQKKVGTTHYRLVRKLTVASVEDGVITKLTGTSTSRQLKACKIQTVPVGRFSYTVTMTLNK